MSSVQFLPFEKQPWTSYLGKKGNSVYEPWCQNNYLL
jgi:hypothetical protein